MLRYEGKKNPEIAEKLDISTDRISHIVSQYKREGLEEFMRVKYTGHNWNMSYEEEQAILDTFAERAEAGQIITVKEIKAVFDEKLGRDTGRGYIYMLLARHKPARRSGDDLPSWSVGITPTCSLIKFACYYIWCFQWDSADITA